MTRSESNHQRRGRFDTVSAVETGREDRVRTLRMKRFDEPRPQRKRDSRRESPQNELNPQRLNKGRRFHNSGLLSPLGINGTVLSKSV